MKPRALGKRGASIVAATLIVTATFAAFAQPGPDDPGDEQPRAEPSRGSSLSSRLSPAVAQRLLRSPAFDDRMRGIRRLGSQNDYGAVQLLLRAIDDDPGLVAEPALRLEAVRAFAPFASRDPVRKLLVTWAADTSSRGRTAGPIGELAREQAAMALAATSNARAVEQLVLAIIDGGPAGDRAARALEAHPPRNIEPLLQASSLESPEVVNLIGQIGDLRAIPKLRDLLKKADLDVKVAAAVALARLGDASGVKLARDWLAQDGSTHSLRVGAARTLTLTRDPLAPRAVAILLADPATRAVGLTLAEQAPTPQLSPTLAGLLTIERGEQRVRVLAALARAGGPLAVKTLGALASKSPVDVDAAFALAHCRDAGASSVISSLLSNPRTRRAGARAGLVRAAERGEEPDGLQDAIATLAASRDDADRSVGVFGLVLTDKASVDDYASSKDDVSVMAACRAALAKPSAAREPCLTRLSAASNPVMRDSLAGTLLGAESPRGVSTNTILSWAESTRVSAPIFGRALGPRDHEAFRTRIKRLLTSGDPAVRSQVAIGLGRSPDASTASLLTQAYAFEADPWVRRAIVSGLALRRSAVGQAWLEQAARLDPDTQVRSLARHALAGRHIPLPSRGDQILWLRLSATPGSAPAGGRPVRLVMSNGFATVAVTAADGEVLVPGLPPGPVLVRVAETPTNGSPPVPGGPAKQEKSNP